MSKCQILVMEVGDSKHYCQIGTNVNQTPVTVTLLLTTGEFTIHAFY